MLSTSKTAGARLLSTAALPRLTTATCPTCFVLLRKAPTIHRTFNTTAVSSQRVQLPQLNLNVKSGIAEPMWAHPIYSDSQLNEIKIAHRKTSQWSDWIALSAVRVMRWSFDLATGYKHDNAVALGKKDPSAAAKKYAMSEEKWMTRFIFLESIAGVPGMVGGMVRHLESLRVLRKDNGWISTLLEESQNERMHLLTFLEFKQPGWFTRFMLLAGQGVFFNLFFIAYLMSPRTCHRFVGYLEEEAVITYSRTIADFEAGNLPGWANLKAPQIAKDYWKMEDGKDGILDLLKVVRADEAKHREVNHTLANLEQKCDPNPYIANWVVEGPRPTKDLKWSRETGWERDELAKIAALAKVPMQTPLAA